MKSREEIQALVLNRLYDDGAIYPQWKDNFESIHQLVAAETGSDPRPLVASCLTAKLVNVCGGMLQLNREGVRWVETYRAAKREKSKLNISRVRLWVALGTMLATFLIWLARPN